MELFLVSFSHRAAVERDISTFIRKFAPENLPRGKALRNLMGKVTFSIAGFEADAREIEFIPEARSFYQHFFKTWPYWLFFCSLQNDTLRAMTLCCMSDLSMIQKDGEGTCKVSFDVVELGDHLLQAFPPMNWCCERAGMSERDIKKRSDEVFRYFNFKIR